MLDIDVINETITELENDDTTFSTCQKLASLYIVRDNLKQLLSPMVDGVNNELEDILPYYIQYCDIKTRYQLNQTTKDEVVQGMNKVCKEITEFIDALYSGTDMNKERLCIKDMLVQLNEKYSK